jgi:DNA-binding transcriptional ArsR family regulator
MIVQGPSSSGKSYVLEQVANLFPPEAVLVATDITSQALYYMTQGELKHRYIVAGERSRKQNDDTAQATKALREMISSRVLSKLVTINLGDGPRTVEIRQEGPIAFAESTTATELFEEDANRCLVLQPDERPEQTRRIIDAASREWTGEQEPGDREALRQELHTLHRLLEPVPVVMPYGRRLFNLLPDQPVEVRRAAGHVASMIQALALLHQHQRPRDEQGRIIAQPEDYWWTRQLLGDVLGRSLGGQPPAALRRFVEALQSLSGVFTTTEIAVRLKLSPRTAREHLNSLLALGAIEQTQPYRGPLPASWLVNDQIHLRDGDDNPLPPVDAVCALADTEWEEPELPADWASADLMDVPF